MKRFISSDDIGVILASPYGLIDKNLYSYCDNNPVMRVDHGGKFWDFVLDVVSIVLGACDLIEDPSWEKAGLLAVDVVLTVVPFIPSVSGARHSGKVDDVVDVASTINKMDNVADAANTCDNTIDSYRALKKTTKGTGLEVHHIVEKRFKNDLYITNTNDMLSIVLTKSEHRIYTNAWRREIGYSTGRHTAEEIWSAAKRIYIDRPDLLEAARKTIFWG